MKLKYYLKGAGLGIIFATLIMILSCSLHNNEMSRDEIIKEAEKLGMIMPQEEEVQKDTSSKDDELPEDEAKPQESENKETTNPQGTQPANVTISVQQGWGARKFAEALLEKGLIQDAVSFEKLLSDSGVGYRLMVGDYVFPESATEEQIIEIVRSTNELLIQ